MPGLQGWLEGLTRPVVAADAPSAAAVDAVAGMEFGSVADDDVLSVIATLERSVSWLQAMQARALSSSRGGGRAISGKTGVGVDEAAGDEVAAVLRVAPRTGSGRLDWAIELSSRLPKTLAAMETGQVTYSKRRCCWRRPRTWIPPRSRPWKSGSLLGSLR